jgi:tetratricopeptide (TPR) repeat protein
MVNPLNRKNGFFLLAFIVIGSLIYGNTLDSPFYLDDTSSIVENPHIRITEVSAKNLLRAGTKSHSKNRPIANISFAFNYYFREYNVAGYHVFNIIIHILSGIFLFLFIEVTLNISPKCAEYKYNRLIAFFSAALWFAHPIQIQSVTYIVQRMNSMASMFYVLSLLCYVRGRIPMTRDQQLESNQKKRSLRVQLTSNAKFSCFSYVWLFGCVLSGLLALGSKQNAATLPFFIFLYEWFFFQDLSFQWLKRYALRFVFVLIIIVVSGYILFIGTDSLEEILFYHAQDFTMPQRLLTEFRVILYYISLILYPHPSRFSLEHDFELSLSLIEPPTTILAICAVTALIVLAVYLAKRERLISFSILWFFGNLAIESSVIGLALVFEHRTYLPSMFFFLPLMTITFRVFEKGLARRQWLSTAGLSSLVLVFSISTIVRNDSWKDPISFWEDCIKKSASNPRPHLNLGNVYKSRGDLTNAIECYTRAIELDPRNAKAHNNLGIVLTERGNFDEAIDHYRKSLQFAPDNARIHYNLGVALSGKRDLKGAISHYAKALHIEPDYAEAYTNMGNALAQQGKFKEATIHYEKALEINPQNAESHYNLANSLSAQEKFDKAVKHYSEALRTRPNFAEAHYELGNVLIQLRKNKEAFSHYRQALQIRPNYAAAHNRLGVLLVQNENYKEAIGHFQEVIRTQPDHAEAQNNLGVALVRQGKLDEAIASYRKAVKINPAYAKAHDNLGTALAQKGEYNGSAVHFREALRTKGHPDAKIHNNLGIVLARQGQLSEAVFHFQEALRIKPDYASANENLKKILAVLGNIDEKLKMN